MHVILGATGHIGASLTQALLDRGESAVVISRDESKARAWRERGARIAILDVRDTHALRAAFDRGRRLFILNPPAAPASDTDIAERGTMHAIVSALSGSPIEKIVAESTYGAQRGTKIGDLGILGELEQALSAQPIPTTIVRGAYYMTNWDPSLATARDEGVLHTFYPVDYAMPMVAPADLGKVDARLMMEPIAKTGLHHVEGPARYSSTNVASAFSMVLGRRVTAIQTPRSQWMATLKKLGFSPKAAESFCGMTDSALATAYPTSEHVTQCPTSLHQYIEALVRRSQRKAA